MQRGAPSGEVIPDGVAGAADREEGPKLQHPLLHALEGHGEPSLDGLALLEDVYDLMRRRLPQLDPDDPVRLRLQPLLPALGHALGRPRLTRVGDPRTASQRPR